MKFTGREKLLDWENTLREFKKIWRSRRVNLDMRMAQTVFAAYGSLPDLVREQHRELISPLKILRRPLERDFSRYFSELIRCEGGSIGKIFLNELLRTILKNIALSAGDRQLVSDAKVELTTVSVLSVSDEPRQLENIDVLISLPNYIFAFEFKLPGFKESPGQTKREADALEMEALRSNKKWIAFLVDPDGELPADERFNNLSYRTISEAMQATVELNYFSSSSEKNLNTFLEIIDEINK